MIDLPQELGNKLKSGMETDGGIKLPFPAPIFWVINGDAKMKTKDAQYYGGWASKEADLEDALQQLKLDLPAGIELTEMSTKDGKEYGAYITRSLLVAPIAKRQAWIVTRPDGSETRKERYSDGEKARQHVQILCQLAVKTGDGIFPWSPIVLSAKGYQAMFLMNAFKEWDKHTLDLRRKIAPNAPYNLFYCAVGTFGKEREAKPVGKNAQSPVTPIKVYLPELTDKDLERLYVGSETANAMSIYLDDAQEWLNAWKDNGKAEPQSVDAQDAPEAPPF